MQEKFDGKGLTILSATGQPRADVDGFVEEFGAVYPILCEAGGGIGQYRTKGVPTAYLIGADGTVVWHGHPANLQDSDIEDHLKDVDKAHRVSSWAFMVARALPAFPAKLSAVQKLLEKKKFGSALKKVEGTLPKLEGEAKEAGETIRTWIADRASSGTEKAAGLVRDGQVYKGFLAYERIEEEFKGHDLGKQARLAAKALKADKAMALEIKASVKLEKAKKEMAKERKAEDKLKCLKPVLSKKYADTSAGKEAAELAEVLEKKAGK